MAVDWMIFLLSDRSSLGYFGGSINVLQKCCTLSEKRYSAFITFEAKTKNTISLGNNYFKSDYVFNVIGNKISINRS